MKRRRNLRRAVCALTLAGMLPLLGGCMGKISERAAEDISQMEIRLGVEAPQEDGYAAREETVTLYFLNEDGSSLHPVTRTVAAQEGMSRSEAALRALMEGPQEEEKGVFWPAIGNLTGERVYELSGGIATVNLPSRARALTPEEMYAVRMAITDTLTEFGEVSYVNVLIGGREEGFDLAGTLAVGALSRAEDLDIASRYARLDEQRQSAHGGITRDTTLYFPTPDGLWTLPEVRAVTYASASPIEYLYTLLEELGKGSDSALATDMPAPMDYIEEMPEIVRTEDATMLAVEIRLSASIDGALEAAGLTRGVYLAALTDTLMGFIPGVDGVRVMIGGKALEGVDAQDTPRGEAIAFEQAVAVRADFVGYVGAPCTVYLPASRAGKLRKASCVLAQEWQGSPRERLKQLIREGALPSELTDADILAVRVEEERVLVNLSGAFAEALAALDPQEERVAVYAMVNTLTEEGGITGMPERVAFFFDGEQTASLAGGLELRGELTRNPGMVVDE